MSAKFFQHRMSLISYRNNINLISNPLHMLPEIFLEQGYNNAHFLQLHCIKMISRVKLIKCSRKLNRTVKPYYMVNLIHHYRKAEPLADRANNFTISRDCQFC